MPPNPEEQLLNDVGGFTHNPAGFVRYNYKWGEDDLAKFTGPEKWQTEVMGYISERLKHGSKNGHQPIRIAVASGHGIGKSALVSWLMEWGLATCLDTKIVCTANTAPQLATKTWPELSTWHYRGLTQKWFQYSATSLRSTRPKHDKWAADALPWNKTHTESFAGLHNQGKRIVVIFDEASAIDDKIWEVTEGALTDKDTEIIWVAFGNPTRNVGRFYDCFHGQKHLWKTWQVDSRTVSLSNKEQITEWVKTYGEDSDFVKIRVRGEFPSTSDRQFISTAIVEAARKRVVLPRDVAHAAKIITVDPAYTGGDPTVSYMRQGNFLKKLFSFPKNDDDFATAGYVARHEAQEDADAVFIDFGYGTGIKSGGKQMGREWQLIQFGAASPDPQYLNMRAYMWGQFKKYMQEGGAIPDDPALAEEITNVEYYVVATGPNAGKICLESKDDMKRRGLKSPNDADCCAMSFAYPVTKKADQYYPGSGKAEMCVTEYDPLA